MSDTPTTDLVSDLDVRCIDQELQRYGAANCWTGTLASKARTLVKRIRSDVVTIDALQGQVAALQIVEKDLRGKLAQRVPHKAIECKQLEDKLEKKRQEHVELLMFHDQKVRELEDVRKDRARLQQRLAAAERAKQEAEEAAERSVLVGRRLLAEANAEINRLRFPCQCVTGPTGPQGTDAGTVILGKLTPAPPGTTAKFGTGAVRSAEVEEFRYDLVSPIGLREIARTCAEGARKYSDFNWEKGMPVHDLLNHALAHIYRFLGGDRSEPHLPHAGWNVLAAIHSLELWPHLNAGTLRGEGCVPPATVSRPAETRASGGTAQPSSDGG